MAGHVEVERPRPVGELVLGLPEQVEHALGRLLERLLGRDHVVHRHRVVEAHVDSRSIGLGVLRDGHGGRVGR